MTAFSQRVADLAGVAEDRLERLAGGDLSKALLVAARTRPLVAKAAVGGTEAAMLRTPAGVAAGCRRSREHDGLLLLDYVANDGVLSPNAWADIGAELARLHARTGESYGWPVDYALGTVALDNREGRDWPRFWGEQRLAGAARLLDRPWRERVERLAERLGEALPARRPLPPHAIFGRQHLVFGGRLASLIDPPVITAMPSSISPFSAVRAPT